jgi:hypothetical protein
MNYEQGEAKGPKVLSQDSRTGTGKQSGNKYMILIICLRAKNRTQDLLNMNYKSNVRIIYDICGKQLHLRIMETSLSFVHR